MLELIRHAPATDAGLLDLGFRPDTFADDPPVNPTAGSDADTPVYGPASKLDFEAFIQSEEGGRATTQLKRSIDAIAQFARDRGEETIAQNIAHLHHVLDVGAKDPLQSHYLPDLYSWGKPVLERIVAELGQLGHCTGRRMHDVLRHLDHLGDGIRNRCGALILQELKTAENGLRQLGGGLKDAVVRVCQNTADEVITQTLARSGADVRRYTGDAHIQPQFARRLGLPWARIPADDRFFIPPSDFQQRIQPCRDAVRQSVTPALVTQTLASQCMSKVQTKLRKWTGETPDLDGQHWPVLVQVVGKVGRHFGELQAERFVRGDGIHEPRRFTDDLLPILSDIRVNMVKADLVDNRDDIPLWQDNEGSTRWTLTLKQGDIPAVIEDDGVATRERTPLPADWMRALLALSNALDPAAMGPLSDPQIRDRMIAGAIADQMTPPATWDAALLMVPGVFPQVCAPLADEAVDRLLSDIASRPDATETGLTCVALAQAVQRELPAATRDLIGVIDLADLRTVWRWIQPSLGEALLAANDALADAGMTALDRLSADTEGPTWAQCRRALHTFRRNMQAWVNDPTTSMPPWPDAALQRLGDWHRQGLMSGSTIVTLLQGDATLGVFLDITGRQGDPEALRDFLAGLARTGDALSLSREDMRSLLRPIQRSVGKADRVVNSPLFSAEFQERPAHVREFLSWMTQHTTRAWMPEMADLMPSDEVRVPQVYGPEPAVPRFWRLPPRQLEEALVHLARQGYRSVEETVGRLGAYLRMADASVLSEERCLLVTRQLASDGVFSPGDCVALLSPASPSRDWKLLTLMSGDQAVLGAYLDLVAHLAASHGNLIDVDRLLRVWDGDRQWTLGGFLWEVFEERNQMFDMTLDFASKAHQQGWITETQLAHHRAGREAS